MNSTLRGLLKDFTLFWSGLRTYTTARIPSNSARVAWQSSSLYSRICFCTVSSFVSKTGKRKKYAPASGQDRPCIRSLEGGAVWVIAGRAKWRHLLFSELLATTSLPIASTAASYLTRAQHIALKFDGELFRLYVISAQASPPRRIIRSIHLLRINPIYHLTEGKAISERTKAALAAAKARDTGLARPSAQSVSPGIAPYFPSASSLRQRSN